MINFKAFIKNFIWSKIRNLIHVFKYKVSIGFRVTLNKVQFGRHCIVSEGCRIENSIVGSYTYFSENCYISSLIIGKYCSVGPGLRVGLGRHPVNECISTSPFMYHFNDKDIDTPFSEHRYVRGSEHFVKIGSDVWLGANVVIADGVEIGDGAIIGACSYVNCDVPPYSVYGGVPAKLLKYRFSVSEIEFLRDLKWWDLPSFELAAISRHFSNPKKFFEEVLS
jgi:acetyltransferase-like isoleucine patch superfamily enzyme